MQQTMMGTNRHIFMRELNEHEMNGWEVVPGTFAVHSVRRVAAATTFEHNRLPDGTTFEYVYSVTIRQAAQD